MPKTLSEVFTDIADAIREKTGGTNRITPLQMSNEILTITGGDTEASTDSIVKYISPIASAAVTEQINTANDSLENWIYRIENSKIIISNSQYHYSTSELDLYRGIVILRSQYTVNGTTYNVYIDNSTNNSNLYISCPSQCVIEYLRPIDSSRKLGIRGATGQQLIIQQADSCIVEVELYNARISLLAMPSNVTFRFASMTHTTVQVDNFYYFYAEGSAPEEIVPTTCECIDHFYTEPGALPSPIDLASDCIFHVYMTEGFSALYYDSESLPTASGMPESNTLWYKIYTDYYTNDNQHDYSAAQSDLESYAQEMADRMYEGRALSVHFEIYSYDMTQLAAEEYIPAGGGEGGGT